MFRFSKIFKFKFLLPQLDKSPHLEILESGKLVSLKLFPLYYIVTTTKYIRFNSNFISVMNYMFKELQF